jgi:hypothetical protein
MNPCDLRYGSLYVGDDWDWFQSSGHRDSRGRIKDLGPISWDSQIKVPFITPLPKLLPGEQRNITVDASGKDGADGAPGAHGAPGEDGVNGADADYPDREYELRRLPKSTANPTPDSNNSTFKRKKHDGVPKVDPIFVKAIVGHMYAIRVVDEQNDFYALFRVEEIKKGDSVVVSWRRIDAPPEPANKH